MHLGASWRAAGALRCRVVALVSRRGSRKTLAKVLRTCLEKFKKKDDIVQMRVQLTDCECNKKIPSSIEGGGWSCVSFSLMSFE